MFYAVERMRAVTHRLITPSDIKMSNNSPRSTSSRSAARDQNPHALRVLIVDDDISQRLLLALAARQAGHAVTEAGGCAEATAKLGAEHFDCITLDLQLADGSGTEVLKAVAATGFAGEVIVISGMNAASRTGARSVARSAGIEVQSLPKPVDIAAFRICLANLGKTAMGLPAVHRWGGVVADAVAAQHRPTAQASQKNIQSR